jgi:hypothetical protein
MITNDSSTQTKPLLKIYRFNVYEYVLDVMPKKDMLSYFFLSDDEEENCIIHYTFKIFNSIYFWEYIIKMNSKNNDDEELNYVALAFFNNYIKNEAKRIMGNNVKFVMRHIREIEYFD